MNNDVIFLEQEGELIARIESDIDHHSAKKMRDKIDDKLFEIRPNTLTIDFSGVGFMDSSGLGLILGRVEKAGALHISVRLCGASPSIMKLIRLGGLERVKNLTVIK